MGVKVEPQTPIPAPGAEAGVERWWGHGRRSWGRLRGEVTARVPAHFWFLSQGFFCQTEEDFNDWCQQVRKVGGGSRRPRRAAAEGWWVSWVWGPCSSGLTWSLLLMPPF